MRWNWQPENWEHPTYLVDRYCRGSPELRPPGLEDLPLRYIRYRSVSTVAMEKDDFTCTLKDEMSA